MIRYAFVTCLTLVSVTGILLVGSTGCEAGRPADMSGWSKEVEAASAPAGSPQNPIPNSGCVLLDSAIHYGMTVCKYQLPDGTTCYATDADGQNVNISCMPPR